MKKAWMASLVVAASLFAAETVVTEQSIGALGMNSPAPGGMPPMGGGVPAGDMMVAEEPVIPNAPIILGPRVITMEAVGMGVAPARAKTPAHEIALAKRAAIIDGYRQLGEKLHGIRINSRETLEDLMLRNSRIKTKVYSIVRGAQVTESMYKDGLFQVKMEVQIDGRRWYRVLAGREF